MKKINNKGFSTVETVLVLIIAGLIGFIGWYVYQSKQDDKKEVNITATKTVATKASSPKLDTTYTNEYGGYTIKYPSTWKLEKNKDKAGLNEKITSPKGTVLNVSSDDGGRGGDCQPDPLDKPFAAGNACVSNEYLSKEKLNVGNVYYQKMNQSQNGVISFTTEPAEIDLLTKKIAGSDGKLSYTVGVGASDDSYTIELNKPAMGLYTIDEFFANYNSKGDFKPYVYIYANESSKTFLASEDVTTIKAIARTLKVNN